MEGFSRYLKEYLEYNNISQTEFANRLGISQKHMNELLNGKMSITLERAAQIYRLTNIPIEFIINAENISKNKTKKWKNEKKHVIASFNMISDYISYSTGSDGREYMYFRFFRFFRVRGCIRVLGSGIKKFTIF